MCTVFSLGGCLESSFQLSEESRLPRWFVISDGADKGDFSVQMELHSTFSGGAVVFKLYEKRNFFYTQKFTITSDEQPSMRSMQLKDTQEGFPKGYPRYKVITINGLTDIVELRRMEPIFYMSDNPAVWNEIAGQSLPANKK